MFSLKKSLPLLTILIVTPLFTYLLVLASEHESREYNTIPHTGRKLNKMETNATYARISSDLKQTSDPKTIAMLNIRYKALRWRQDVTNEEASAFLQRKQQTTSR